MLPRALQPLLRGICVADLLLGVIGFDEVFNNGATLPDGNTSVRILNGRHSTVRIEFNKRLLLDSVEPDRLDIVRNAEFTQDDEDFVPVSSITKISQLDSHWRIFRQLGYRTGLVPECWLVTILGKEGVNTNIRMAPKNYRLQVWHIGMHWRSPLAVGGVVRTLEVLVRVDECY